MKRFLGKIDESLGVLASEHCPQEIDQTSKKRKADDSESNVPKKKSFHSSKSSDERSLLERETKALEDLQAYIEEVGGELLAFGLALFSHQDFLNASVGVGSRQQVFSFRSRATKRSDGRYDISYFNTEGRRFRSMVDVGRFMNLVKSKPNTARKHPTKKPATSREAETEKRKLRKELDKLLKAHQKATKALDEFRNEQQESSYPVEDDVLIELGEDQPGNDPAKSGAALSPDVDALPGFPSHCIPDLLMIWDFLCTFTRALSLNPIDFPGFVSALTFRSPGTTKGDSSSEQPPVYLAEAHLSLLKLLLQDRGSDDWWWSILETDESSPLDESEGVGPLDKTMPVIRVDMAALLAYEEDPLITASWLQALEDVRNKQSTAGREIRQAVKNALVVVANRWVKAYLRKSLTHWKVNSAGFTKRAVVWLTDRVRDARPDLWGRNVSKEVVFKQRAKVVSDVMSLMAKIDDAADVLTVEEPPSDDESDDDDEFEDDFGEEDMAALEQSTKNNNDESKADETVKSAVPIKPPPTVVDLLLPPSKPHPQSDVVNPFTWSSLAGAAGCRILHHYKRLRNEADDKLRESRELPPMLISERRSREAEFAGRIFSESFAAEDDTSPAERATGYLSAGGSYLDLSPVERCCVLKVLIEGAYDTGRVFDVVDGNFKARINAVKALEAEERRAKRESREEAAAAEIAAREKLTSQARSRFLEEKRAELRKLNQATNEYSDEFIEELDDEDIIEFDEDTKAEYDALPKAGSFSKSEVMKMVRRMQEEAAFETESVSVITMAEIEERDKAYLDDMLEREGFLQNAAVDRESSRRLERVRRDIAEFREMEENLPHIRERAVEAMREAIEEGTIKALRSAFRAAKQARLMGQEGDSGGVWALDVTRDVALELKSAEGRKRVIEAQKDLVAKRNKCFIRSEPIGRDRFRNNFWHLAGGDGLWVWVEAEFLPGEQAAAPNGYVDITSDLPAMKICSEEKEDDLVKRDLVDCTKEEFLRFCRQEFHSSGFSSSLAKHHWGCHASEKRIRNIMKTLDSRGKREQELKTRLKEVLEASRHAFSDESEQTMEQQHGDAAAPSNSLETKGDERFLEEAGRQSGDSELRSLMNGISSAFGRRVRLRLVVDEHKEPVQAQYVNGSVSGWKILEHETEKGFDATPVHKAPSPVWNVVVDGGGDHLLHGDELVEAIGRHKDWFSGAGGYEDDAAFLSYRNSLGRHCGRAADAGTSSTPYAFGRLMVRREQDLYSPLKARTFDNNWGGKNGARNIWTSTMREECFDIDTARKGLLTLEGAFFELMGGDCSESEESVAAARATLGNPTSRFEIELESIEKTISGLWNSAESRAIFREIVSGRLDCAGVAVVIRLLNKNPFADSRTTSVLALALDLLCRNCRAFLDAHKMPEIREARAPLPRRTTRSMNAWQQANQDWL